MRDLYGKLELEGAGKDPRANIPGLDVFHVDVFPRRVDRTKIPALRSDSRVLERVPRKVVEY